MGAERACVEHFLRQRCALFVRQPIAVGVVGAIGGIGECGLRLGVPHLFVIFVGESFEAAFGIFFDGVMIAGDIHRLQILGIGDHLARECAGHFLIRSDDFDAMEQFTFLVRMPAGIRIVRAIAFEAGLIGVHAVREFSHPIQIGGALVDIGVDRIRHDAVFAVCGQNRVLVPAVHIVVGMHPGRRHPTQEAHFGIRIVAARVGGELEAGFARDRRIVVAVTHGRDIRSGRIVAVIAHFDFDGVHQRPFAAEERLHHPPICRRLFRFVIKKQAGCGITREHAKAFIGQTVTVSRSSFHRRTSQLHFHYRGPYRRSHQQSPSIVYFVLSYAKFSRPHADQIAQAPRNSFDCDLAPTHIRYPTSPVISTNTGNG